MPGKVVHWFTGRFPGKAQRQAERMLGDYQKRMAAAGRISTIVSVTVEPIRRRGLR